MFITPLERTLCQTRQGSSQALRDLVPCLYTKESRVKSLTPIEKFNPWHIEPVQVESETSSRHSEADKDMRLVLEEQRNQLLSEAKSELLKQECRAERADAIICEHQREIQSDRMEIGNTHEESRRERAQLCEELSLQERAHQETRIRSIHDVEKLK